MPASTMVATATDTRHRPTRGDALAAIHQGRRDGTSGAARAEGAGASTATGEPQASPLGNHAKTAATAGHAGANDRRSERYRARRWLSEVTGLGRVSRCGRVPVTEDGAVHLRVAGEGESRSAGYGGLTTCGSVWACPVCSAKIAAQRTGELEQLLAWNAARGGSVALATFTMSHHAGHGLRALRTALSGAWRHITSSRAWKATRKELGCDGYVRAIECTHGGNGWHLHAHVLLVFDGPVSQDMITAWADELYGLWSDGLAKHGMTASREHGVDLRVGSNALDGLGKYLSKITFEAAGGRFKQGRKGGRTPFELLSDAMNTGLDTDWQRWFAWETGSRGMRQLTWSRGLKARVGIDDVTDEQAAEDTEDGGTVAVIAASSWKALFHTHDGGAELLAVTERYGVASALAWLDQRGYVWEEGPALTPD